MDKKEKLKGLKEKPPRFKLRLAIILTFLIVGIYLNIDIEKQKEGKMKLTLNLSDEHTKEPISSQYSIYHLYEEEKDLGLFRNNQPAYLEKDDKYIVYFCDNDEEYYSNRYLIFTAKNKSNSVLKAECRKKGKINISFEGCITNNQLVPIKLTLKSDGGLVRNPDICIGGENVELVTDLPTTPSPRRINQSRCVSTGRNLYYDQKNLTYIFLINTTISHDKSIWAKFTIVDNELNPFNEFYSEKNPSRWERFKGGLQQKDYSDIGIEDFSYVVNLKEHIC